MNHGDALDHVPLGQRVFFAPHGVAKNTASEIARFEGERIMVIAGRGPTGVVEPTA